MILSHKEIAVFNRLATPGEFDRDRALNIINSLTIALPPTPPHAIAQWLDLPLDVVREQAKNQQQSCS